MLTRKTPKQPLDCGRPHPQECCLCLECEASLIHEAFNDWRPAGKHPVVQLERASTGEVHALCSDCGGEWAFVRKAGRIRFVETAEPTDPECLS